MNGAFGCQAGFVIGSRTLGSWFISPIYRTYPTYLYMGYNPFTKYQ